MLGVANNISVVRDLINNHYHSNDWLYTIDTSMNRLWDRGDPRIAIKSEEDSMTSIDNLWVTQDKALLDGPDMITVDILSRFKSRFLPQRGDLWTEGGNVFLELSNVKYRFYGMDKLTGLGHDAYGSIFRMLLSLIRYFYSKGIYIYPNLSNILIYSEAALSYREHESLTSLQEIMWIPSASQVSLTYISEHDLIRKNAILFRQLNSLVVPELRGKDVGMMIMKNPRFYNRVKNNWNRGLSLEEYPTFDSIDISLANDIPQSIQWDYGQIVEEMKINYLPIRDSTITNLALLLNLFRTKLPRIPLAYMFAAIELSFIVDADIDSIANLYTDLFQLDKGTVTYSNRNTELIIRANGRILSNPVYLSADGLGQLDTFYSKIIIEKPELYPRVDYVTWFREIGQSGSDKHITVYDFFN